jgi:hypothetical protein
MACFSDEEKSHTQKSKSNFKEYRIALVAGIFGSCGDFIISVAIMQQNGGPNVSIIWHLVLVKIYTTN